MAERTLALYDRTLAAAPAAGDGVPCAPARVRDALGYVAWTMPALSSPPPAVAADPVAAAAAVAVEPTVDRPSAALAAEAATGRPAAAVAGPPSGLVADLARMAIRLAPTLPGRALRRLTPARIRAALKARLR